MAGIWTPLVSVAILSLHATPHNGAQSVNCLRKIPGQLPALWCDKQGETMCCLTLFVAPHYRGAEVSRGHSSRLADEGPNDGQGN